MALLAAGGGLRQLPALAQQAGEPTPAPAGSPPHTPASPLFNPTPPILETVTGGGELPSFVRPREAWQAAAAVQPYVPHSPTGVSLHHTGTVWAGRPSPEQYLRNIQAFHVGPEREWEDIAYHFLVDLEGNVWAGRPPTVRGNPSIYYDPTGLILICLLGDYTAQELAEPQIAAAAKTAAWAIRRFELPPDKITGHRDHAPTSCPGTNVYRLLQEGAFVARVKDLLK